MRLLFFILVCLVLALTATGAVAHLAMGNLTHPIMIAAVLLMLLLQAGLVYGAWRELKGDGDEAL